MRSTAPWVREDDAMNVPALAAGFAVALACSDARAQRDSGDYVSREAIALSGTTETQVELRVEFTTTDVGEFVRLGVTARGPARGVWRDLCALPCALRLEPGRYGLRLEPDGAPAMTPSVEVPRGGLLVRVHPGTSRAPGWAVAGSGLGLTALGILMACTGSFLGYGFAIVGAGVGVVGFGVLIGGAVMLGQESGWIETSRPHVDPAALRGGRVLGATMAF
jgi:hypothetical protein